MITWVVLAEMGDTAIASVLAALIAGLVAWGTARSAKKGQIAAAEAAAEATVAATTVTSRTAIEQGAFERAKEYYTDTMDRQQNEIKDLESDKRADHDQIMTLKARVDVLESEKRADRHHIESLEYRVQRLETEKNQLATELELARTLLHHRFPEDE